MTQPFALTIRAPRDRGYAIAEALGFDDITEALAVSIFDDGPDHVSIQAIYEAQSQATLARSTIPAELEATVLQLPDEDWVGMSQAGLPPIIAGRVAIHGSHDPAPDGAEFPILVNAGQAFGTGHHGTTKACLLMLDGLQANGERPAHILDLGTGAGILAIAAAKLFPRADITATDIDPVAVDVAQQNAELNAVAFDCVTADGFNAPELSGRQFDLIIANILAGPLRGLAPDLYRATAPKGQAILSGILDEQAQWVADAFRAVGFSIEAQPSLDGWTSLFAQK